MSSSRRHVQPVVVEVQPSNLSASPPISPTSPKAVRFAPSSNNAVSRPLSTTEAWSLYHFENHARHCLDCYEPHKVFLRGGRLCPIGHGLAQDVAYHVYHLNGEFYSTAARDNAAKLVRVEIPAPYTNLRGLLRSMDRALRTHHTQRPVPIISHDRTYPILPRRATTSDIPTERAQVILEPATSPRKEKKKSHHHRSKSKSRRYSTVIVDSSDAVDSGYEYDDGDYSVKAPSFPMERRASSGYERESPRRSERYRVEIREPEAPRRRREERRSSMFWD